jgi:hypothetical protein
MNNRLKISCFFLLVFAGVSLRLLCRDIPNFAPVGALALFAGFFFRSYLIAAMVPVSVITISNLQLGGYENVWVMISVYVCFICYVAAIPFFRYTLAGDFFFCFVFFGGYELVTRLLMSAQTEKAAVVAD